MSDRYSPWLRRWFVWYLRGYFSRNFHAVRISRGAPTPQIDGRPLIVFANHPSWWDPIHLMLVGSFELPELRLYAPMDARALKRYTFFERLGAFPVERGTRRGSISFVRNSLEALADPGASLWLTASGQFSDPRDRSVRLLPGLAHLVRRLDDACVVPLAVEYPFWDESHPEALTRFGKPTILSREPRRSVEAWTQLFDTRLEETMDALAEDAQSRDPGRFRTLVQGRSGIGGVYDQGRRLKSFLRGQRFDPSHGSVMR